MCAASHTYTTPGEYPIKVMVTNTGSGNSVTMEVTIVITPEEGQ
jgi:PKD repeat protein